ncbi:MAG TPA: sulfatase-like hydrolase/transferase [Bryocella sp.]|nr:sulfatase-like hydrolase/transferase [Bryocella sp.]
MDRREFVKRAAAASASAALPFQAEAAKKHSGKRPNVLYVFSDQHRAASLPGEPFSEAIAPAFAKFRRENLSMDACIANYPLCTPARAILLSGLSSTQSHMIHNGQTLEPVVPGLGDTFQQAGYHTGYVGKWHLYHGESEFVPKGPYRFGFEDWHAWANTNKHYDGITFDPETGERVTMPGYQPTRMTDQAIEFLNKQSGAEKPWLLVVAWNPPHPPYDPPADDKNLYNPSTLKFRPNVRLSTAADKLFRPYPQLESFDTLRQAEEGYYGGISAVDKEFARLLKTLDDNGMTDDTIVVYTSDHGDMMGSHGHMAKQMPQEESCRVPFFVRSPRMKHARSSEELFAAIDIYPTLCGLAGIPVPNHCSGKDFSGYMHGHGESPAPEMVFLMNEKGPESRQEVDVPTYRGVRTRTHTYAVQLDGRWCLFDNAADPYQMKNLVKEPANKAMIERFDKALIAWSKSCGDAFPYEQALGSYSSYPSA